MKSLHDRNKGLADRLRVFRLTIGLNQKEAAEKFRIPFSTYKRYESGANEPSSESVSGMALMGLNANWLLTGKGEMLLDTSASSRLIQPIKKGFENQANMIISDVDSPNPEGNSSLAIDELILFECLAACKEVYGDTFEALTVLRQIGYATDLYNLLVKMSAPNGKDINHMKRLKSEGMIELLNVFIRLGWARKFPPPPSNQPWAF